MVFKIFPPLLLLFAVAAGGCLGGGASTSSPPTFTLNLSNVTQPNNSSNQSSFDSSSSFAPAFFDPHPLLNSTAINVQANNISTLNAQLSMSGSNIQLAPGSSPSFVNGEQGALVFLDDSFLCSNFSSNNSFLSLNSTLHFSFVNFPLVLLINDNFNCSLNTKIDNIFRDPYPAFLFAIIISTYSSGLLHNLDLSQINTPVFTFDSSVGQALQSAVVAINTTFNSPSSPFQIITRIVITPELSSSNIWKTVMVVVVIVLGFSFLASCIMHIHLMRLKRRQILLQEEQQSQGGEAQELTNFNPTIPAPRCIDPNVLKSFPTRLYREQKKVQEGIGGSDGTKEGNEDLGKKEVSATETAVVVMAVGVEDHDANDSENPDSLLPHSISGSTLHLGASSLLGEDTFLELPLASETSTPHIKTTTAAAPHTPHTTASQQEDAACCICLETFSTEDIVRDLPCSHTYHSRCIDQWLTVKSSCCPLCKRDYF